MGTELTTPWFDSEIPPLKRIIQGIELERPGGPLGVMPVRVVELDGTLLVMTESAIYAEVDGP